MKILVDTHILFWILTGDKKLSKRALAYITDSENEVFYSVVSPWEVSTKHISHPDKMPFTGSTIINACQKTGFKVISVSRKHIETLDTLKRGEKEPPHKDPFDRMLLAQAKAEDMLFLTRDELILGYNEPCVIMA